MKRADKIKVGIATLFVILLGVGFFSVRGILRTQDEGDPLAQARQEKAEVGKNSTTKQATETMNVLLLGLDGESKNEDIQNQEARADTMMVVSINPQTQTTKVVSLPRDTYVYDGNAQDFVKLNATYVYGGPEGAVKAVEEFLHIPIDFYVTVNMTGLESLVNAIGGVEVTPPLTFSYHDTYFEEGVARHVSGIEAMNYVRMRKEDPRGDFGRQDRQQEVVKAIITKLLAMESVDYFKLVPFILQHVRTNVEVTKGYAMYAGYRNAVKDIKKISLEDGVVGMTYREQYFAYIKPDIQLRVVNELREHSGLTKFIILNSPPMPVEGDTETEAPEEPEGETTVYHVPSQEIPVKEIQQVEESVQESVIEPVKPEPVKPEPVKPEPVKPEPVKPEPVKPEPVEEVISLEEEPVQPESLEYGTQVVEEGVSEQVSQSLAEDTVSE